MVSVTQGIEGFGLRMMEELRYRHGGCNPLPLSCQLLAEVLQTGADGGFEFEEFIDEFQRIFGVGTARQAGFVGGRRESVSCFGDAPDGCPPATGFFRIGVEKGVGFGAGRFLEAACFVGRPSVSRAGNAVCVRGFNAPTAGDFVGIIAVVLDLVEPDV